MNRSYWPDAEATGQLLTELCEDLAAGSRGQGSEAGGQRPEDSTPQGHNASAPTLPGSPPAPNHRPQITVLCGQPNANPTGAAYRRWGREVRNGVTIHRVWHTRFPKSFLPGRAVNHLSFLLAALWAACWTRRPDVVVAETDPPLLSLIGGLLQRWRGARLIVYLQDIHPDIAVALGKLRDSRMTRLLRRRLFAVYRRADRVVVLSRDMRQHVIAGGVPAERVVIVPNWIDTALVVPVKQDNAFRQRHGIDSQFLVMYSGNLGLCQRLEDVIAAAECLRRRADIVFLLVGGGVLQQQLETQVAERALGNVRFLPYEPKSRLAESLSAADVHLVPLDPRVAACLMPSKLYGVLASGTPLVAVAPEACELAELTRQHGVGLVAPPGDPAALAAVIEQLADNPEYLSALGRQARQLAEQQYDRRHITTTFANVLNSVLRARSEAE